MKPLNQLNNVERAKLLHELFPEQINSFISYVEQTAKDITSAPENVKDQWGTKSISADVWIQLAARVQHLLADMKSEIVSGSDEFASQLFSGYTGLFLIQCLQDYIAICPNSKFNKAIELFFDV